VVGSARALLTAIINDLNTLRSQVPGPLKHKLLDAITNLKAALAPSLWQDDSHLAPGAGQTVFKLCEKAFVQLRSLRHHGHGMGLPAGVTSTMLRIVNFEQTLAMLAISNSTAGDTKDLAHASQALWASLKAIGNGDSLGAMDQLSAACKDAEQATKHPAPSSDDKGKKDKADGDDQGDDD
jgi:hypothetical protein